MAVDDLPLPVVNFLNVIGVPWPYIDEDAVSRFASLTRDFAGAVEDTHADATRAIAGIAESHQAVSTEAMSSGWAQMSSRHVYEVVDACHVLAEALDVAAGYIVAQKAEAIAILIGMAAAFVADQAAAVATAGVAEADARPRHAIPISHRWPGVLMAGGGLSAVLRALARDAAGTAGRITESVAKITEQTAAIEEGNLREILASDARAAEAIAKAGGRMRRGVPSTHAPVRYRTAKRLRRTWACLGHLRLSSATRRWRASIFGAHQWRSSRAPTTSHTWTSRERPLAPMISVCSWGRPRSRTRRPSSGRSVTRACTSGSMKTACSVRSRAHSETRRTPPKTHSSRLGGTVNDHSAHAVDR